jgi:hypothetical protein
MRVLRDGPSDLSMRLPYITRPTGYVRGDPVSSCGPLVCIYMVQLCLSIINRSHHLAGSAVPLLFLFDQYYIYYYSVHISIQI